jgi:hypothetical protein
MANLIEQMNVLKGLDDASLQGEIQSPSGSAPPFLVLTEINRRKDMRQRYDSDKARQKPSTTVVEDVAFGLPAMPASTQGMPGGIGDAMGAPMPPVQGFNDGGLVEAMKRYNTRLSGLGDDRDRARAMALLAASGAILGGGSSNTLKNVGAGIGAFAGSYGDQLKNIDSQELELLRGISTVGQEQRLTSTAAAAEERAQREFEAQAARGFVGDETLFQPIAGVINGQPTYIQAGNKGSVRQLDVPEGFAPPARYEKIDAGDQWIIKDTTTGQTEIIPKQGAPGTNMNVTGLGDERTMAPAPGSPEQVKQAAEKTARAQAATAAYNDFERKTSLVQDTIATAKQQAGFWTTGILGELSKFTGPARDLFETLQTLKANIGFDNLVAMREASPNGAALGNVTEKENALLQAVEGSLEQGQSRPQLLQNLSRIEELYQDVLEEKRLAYQQTFGNASGEIVEVTDIPGTSPAVSGTTTTDIPWSR